MVTGSAPLSASVKDFMRVTMSARMIEGYGLTETAAVASACNPWDHTNFHVGAPSTGAWRLHGRYEAVTRKLTRLLRGGCATVTRRTRDCYAAATRRPHGGSMAVMRLLGDRYAAVTRSSPRGRAFDRLRAQVGRRARYELHLGHRAALRRGLGARPQYLQGLLQDGRTDRRGDRCGRLVPYGGRGGVDRQRLPADHRSQEEHLQARAGAPL